MEREDFMKPKEEGHIMRYAVGALLGRRLPLRGTRSTTAISRRWKRISGSSKGVEEAKGRVLLLRVLLRWLSEEQHAELIEVWCVA